MKVFNYRNILFLLPVLAPLPAAAVVANDGYRLEQVLMFSRHGLRTPLANSGSLLAQSTPKKWPQWDTQGGYLTPKGGVLESYFGKYVNDWMVNEGLFSKDKCPTNDEVVAYANSLQRTIATAQYFVLGAFPGCDVKVYHQPGIGIMDPTFNPVIKNNSAELTQTALNSMNKIAGKNGLAGLNQRLKPSYDLLAKIIDYKNAPVCLTQNHCNLAAEPSEFSLVNDKEPAVTGSLRIGTSISDAFILQYYEGFPLNDIAWGNIKTDKEWKMLASIKDYYGEVLFGSPEVAKNISAPLINYISAKLISTDGHNNSQPKFNLLVGHDSNVSSILSALKIKAYQLPGQFERTPIGGKIVFERWTEKSSGKPLIKIEYLYQTKDQLRNGDKLSMTNPPKRVVLEMQDCPIDVNGFCKFDDFKKAIDAASK
ncbi:bifunctional glucose-1-phosphatase/inositol phosphatase [Budvicia diplopodorum]|uniref:bifunctional glucose-1-phosphatase/inositol phosphatase n=1 Tax=Budvicia diplopodorum TaxID=1119056 RepID=UPI0013578C74|nr:bifunctional glucose-1-phosphatase/inositol phosphatase [Budvicia diplopodorum]